MMVEGQQKLLPKYQKLKELELQEVHGNMLTEILDLGVKV